MSVAQSKIMLKTDLRDECCSVEDNVKNRAEG